MNELEQKQREMSFKMFEKNFDALSLYEQLLLTSFINATEDMNSDDIDWLARNHLHPNWLVYKVNSAHICVEILSNGAAARDINTKKEFHFYTAKNGYRYFWVNDPTCNEARAVFIHRVIATLLVPNPDPRNKVIIHHVNKDRYCNEPWNLRWVTPKEHSDIHQEDINYSWGERAGGAIYKNDQIHQVCELLTKHPEWSYTKISKMTGVDAHTVGEVYRRTSWREISRPYTFPPHDGYAKGEDHPNTKHSEDVIRQICELRANNPSIKREEISKITGVSVRTIKAVLEGKEWKHIRNQYTFPKWESPGGEKSSNVKYSDRQVREVCNLLDSNLHGQTSYTHKEITSMTGVAKDTVTDIHMGRAWTSISNDYDFYKEKIKNKEGD